MRHRPHGGDDVCAHDDRRSRAVERTAVFAVDPETVRHGRVSCRGRLPRGVLRGDRVCVADLDGILLLVRKGRAPRHPLLCVYDDHVRVHPRSVPCGGSLYAVRIFRGNVAGVLRLGRAGADSQGDQRFQDVSGGLRHRRTSTFNGYPPALGLRGITADLEPVVVQPAGKIPRGAVCSGRLHAVRLRSQGRLLAASHLASEGPSGGSGFRFGTPVRYSDENRRLRRADPVGPRLHVGRNLGTADHAFRCGHDACRCGARAVLH